MKRIVRTALMAIVTVLCVLLNLSAQDASKQINVEVTRQEIASGNFAIVVGVNNYSEDDIADLNYCEKDARDFAAALTAEGGYSADRVKLFIGNQATYTAIYAALKSCADAKNIPSKSSILFYFSGHGFAYEDKNYIIPQDGTVFPDLIQSRNLNLESIESMLAGSPFERQLVFIDACRNQVTIGGRDVGVKGFIETPLTANAKGMKVFLGTEFGQVSRESTDIQSGIFTHYLVEGLAGAADANRDGIVLFNELSGYVSTKMEERNIGSKYPQRPVTRGEGSELIPVAALPGAFEEVEAGGTSTGGTVEDITPSGTGSSASGFGTLKLTVGLDSVQCYVDGALKGASTGGAITVENLAPGEHTIKLVKEGYETREFKAQVFAGQIIEKSLNFSKISGIIRVTSNAYPYNIYLDGAYVTLCQSASYDVTDVSYGAHTVVLKKSGYAEAEYKVNITGSAPVEMQGQLTRVYGRLTVITNPSGATVKITSSDKVVIEAGFADKEFNTGAEATSSAPLSLTPGTYTLTISKAGYETVVRSVKVAKNAPAVIDIELLGKFPDINSYEPAGANVSGSTIATSIPINLVLVLDKSGSMFDDGKLVSLKDFVTKLASRINSKSTVNVVVFSDSLFESGSIDPDDVNGFISQFDADGGTNINDALVKGMQLAAKPNSVLIFVTDGLPTVGETDENVILQNIRKIAPSNTGAFVIGLGYDVSVSFLQSVAQILNGDVYSITPDSGTDFDDILNVIVSR